MQTDQDLVAQLRGSDPSPALAELLRRHGRMVERTVLRRVRDEHLAQDVCQAVFWILLQKAGTLKEPGGIGGWLHRTATLAARNALRMEARRKRHEEVAGGMTPTSAATPAPDWPEGFDEALARLPEMYREAIVLRFLEGRSRSEVGRSLALSDKAVDMRVTRAIERLRRTLAGAVPGLTVAALTGILTAEASAATAAGPLATAAAMTAIQTAAVGSPVASIAKGALKTMFWIKMKAIVAATCAAAILAGAGVSYLQGQEKDRRSLVDVEKLHRLIKPQAGESRWMEIDWYPSVWEARKKAAAEGKPLFLWAGSGGAPSAGC